MEKNILSHNDLRTRAQMVVGLIAMRFKLAGASPALRVYPVPRGGIPVAYLLAACAEYPICVVEDIERADCFVDDIVDSGETRRRYTAMRDIPFFALYDKTSPNYAGPGGWLAFPWEASEEKDEGIEDNVRCILQYIGEDPTRGGLLETPARVAGAWRDWTCGYEQDAAALLKVFEDGAENYDEMVVVKDIPFYSHCEHHLAPFFGTATVAYLPNGRIVGLSKLNRLVDMFARRLQVQERMTKQIADALMAHLKPKGCGVVVQARHLCMESRGVKQPGTRTTTSALLGSFRDDVQVRTEFLSLARGG